MKSSESLSPLPVGDLAAQAVLPDAIAAWDRVKRRLRAEFGEDVFSSWFARLDLDGIADDMVRLSVPTRFLRSWIQAHYADKILNLFLVDLPRVTRVCFSVPPAAGPVVRGVRPGAVSSAVPAESPGKPAAPVLHSVDLPSREDELTSSPLDRRMTFDTFFLGRSNALAHSAALQVAKASPGEPALYNPLFIHSAVGLGKSHLIQAVAHLAESRGRRVLYLTAERFMYGFVAALKAQTAIAFKEKLRAIDVLVIDDVQFLQGKSIQQEFCHTLNALIDAGRQVVIAADRPPSELESLDERVRSRLAGGLCVEMGALDEALRVKILETRIAVARAAQPTFEVPAPVISFVARSIQTNGRDLDGAVNRLLAHVTLTGASLTVETAESAIRDLVRTREPKRVKIEDIQKLVATHFNVSRADILSSRRTATVVRPRQIAMYLAKVLTLRSLPEIGRRFGGRDHTTVLHAVRKIEKQLHDDHTLNDEVELLKRMLQV